MMRRVGRRLLRYGLLLGVLTVVGLGPRESAAQVDDETCVTCHDNMAATLHNGPHELSSQETKPAIKIACVSCHTGAEQHVDDPSVDNIGVPSRMETKDVDRICTTCHEPHLQMGVTGFDPHLGADLNCTSCHSVHHGAKSLLLDDKGDFCGKCHVAIKNQFMNRSSHPLVEQDVTCLSCHHFTQAGEPDYGHGGNANCYTCHPQQAGPFRYQHDATSSFHTDGGGCTECHSPHGSANDNLLKQPDGRLCQQCHGIPPLHRTQHGGIATQYTCVECHSDIHGSFDNAHLLDPELGTKIGSGPGSCYCHNVEN